MKGDGRSRGGLRRRGTEAELDPWKGRARASDSRVRCGGDSELLAVPSGVGRLYVVHVSRVRVVVLRLVLLLKVAEPGKRRALCRFNARAGAVAPSLFEVWWPHGL